MNNRERKYFSVYDIFIILIAVVTSVIALLSQLNNSNESLTCVIRVEGEVVHSIDLSSLKDECRIDVSGEYPLVVVIDQSSVRVCDSSCPDKLCEHSGSIKRSGQSIVCLPAKVSVTLQGAENEFDIVAG